MPKQAVNCESCWFHQMCELLWSDDDSWPFLDECTYTPSQYINYGEMHKVISKSLRGKAMPRRKPDRGKS